MSQKIFFILVCAILLAGCAGASGQPVTEIMVEATDFAYNPIAISVPAGEPVTLTLTNKGAVEHDFVVEKINITDVETSDNGPAAHHKMGDMSEYDLHFFAKAGDTAVLNFTALEPGTYEIFCSIEGHKEAGMIGKLIVAAQK